MNYDYKSENLEKVVGELTALYPHVKEIEHRIIATETLDNYLTQDGLMAWYGKTAHKLTSEVISREIFNDIPEFFYLESNPKMIGYTPLAQRDDITGILVLKSAENDGENKTNPYKLNSSKMEGETFDQFLKRNSLTGPIAA